MDVDRLRHETVWVITDLGATYDWGFAVQAEFLPYDPQAVYDRIHEDLRQAYSQKIDDMIFSSIYNAGMGG